MFLQLDVSEGRTQHESESASFGIKECRSSFTNLVEGVGLTTVVDPSHQPIKVGPDQSFWFSGIYACIYVGP
jgi:hypothetical protein